MKKILVLIVLFTNGIICFAQIDFKYGFEVGANFAIKNTNQYYNYNQDDDENNYQSNTILSRPQTGINAGVMFEIDFNDYFSLQPNIVFSFQNSNTDEYYFSNETGFSNKTDMAWVNQNLFYFNIPVNVKFKYPVSKKVSVFMLLGPSFNVGLFGNEYLVKKERKHIAIDDFITKKELLTKTFGDEGYLSRFNFGLNYGIGIELINKICLSVEFNQGLININKQKKVGGHFKTNSISVNIGYLMSSNEAKSKRERYQDTMDENNVFGY